MKLPYVSAALLMAFACLVSLVGMRAQAGTTTAHSPGTERRG